MKAGASDEFHPWTGTSQVLEILSPRPVPHRAPRLRPSDSKRWTLSLELTNRLFNFFGPSQL